jgi:hypothetical protein
MTPFAPQEDRDLPLRRSFRMCRHYDLREIRPEWAALFRHCERRIPLPTEAVVETAQVVEPRQARVFRTGLYLRAGKVVTCRTVQRFCEIRGEAFPGVTGMGDEVLLFESWDDHGSDGHVDYSHDGWVFATWTQVRKLMDECPWRGQGGRGILGALHEIAEGRIGAP